MILRIFVFLLALLAGTQAARADWQEASSDHFLIYADQGEDQVRRFAERLERYHSAMQFVLKREGRKPSPSNRVTVYVVSSEEQVRKLLGGDNRYAMGFYVPRAGGTLAIVPRISTGGSELELSGERVLLHEYAHHVMYGTSSVSYPHWFSEGFAEFYAAAAFEKDGSVGLGRPALHRAFELHLARNVPIETLLDTATYRASKERSKSYDDFYGQSWLLYHYLTFAEERSGQLAKYLQYYLEGKGELDAAKLAFGDLKALDKDLERYLKKRRINYLRLNPAALKTSEIRLRKLDEGEAAIMPVRIRSKRGVTSEMAKELVPQARLIASKFPKNAAVLDALAEAEFDAGDDDAAIRAADQALAINPNNINALLQKGYAMARKAESLAEPKKAWAAVRSQFLKVNAIENDHPIPLIRFYRSFVDNGDIPTDNALDGLVWAMDLAPFDKGLRLNVANALIAKQRYDDAVSALRPILNDTHNEEIGRAAREMTAIAKGKKEEAESAAQATPKPVAR